MKVKRVQYTVKPEYVDQNIANIQTVMAYVRAHPIDGLFYSSYLLPDGVSFMHVSVAKDDETNKKLNEVAAFASFIKELKASEPVVPPKAEDVAFIGSSFELFT